MQPSQKKKKKKKKSSFYFSSTFWTYVSLIRKMREGRSTEAVFKEKRGVWGPMLELEKGVYKEGGGKGWELPICFKYIYIFYKAWTTLCLS